MSAPVWSVPNKIAWNYLFIVDASLTSVTADIFYYNNTIPASLPDVQLQASKTFPGLQSIVGVKKRHSDDEDDTDDEHDDNDEHDSDDEEQEKESSDYSNLLDDIVNFGREILPAQQIARTPLFFYGTGNVRSLGKFDKHKLMRNACKHFKTKSKFLVKDCAKQVLDIHEDLEGILSWVAVNYANSTLGEGFSSTLGSIVLNNGGSSAAYLDEDGPKSKQYKVALPNLGSESKDSSMFNVQVVSHDGLGLGDAWDMYIGSKQGSCINPGHVVDGVNGTGNIQSCEQDINFIYEAVPTIPTDLSYYATGALNTLHENFKTNSSISAFCSTEWAEAQSKYPDAANLERLCFESVYSHRLVEKYIGKSDEDENLLEFKDIKWTRGRAFLYAVGDLSDRKQTLGVQANAGATGWNFAREVARPKLGDWADRLDRSSHRMYGGIVFIAVLFGIIYLLLGKTKRAHIVNSLRGRVQGYGKLAMRDDPQPEHFELEDMSDFEV